MFDTSVKVCLYSDPEPIAIKFEYCNDEDEDVQEALEQSVDQGDDQGEIDESLYGISDDLRQMGRKLLFPG